MAGVSIYCQSSPLMDPIVHGTFKNPFNSYYGILFFLNLFIVDIHIVIWSSSRSGDHGTCKQCGIGKKTHKKNTQKNDT